MELICFHFAQSPREPARMYVPDLTISPSEEPVEEFEPISLEDAKNGKGKYMYARKKVLRKYTMPAVWFLAYINNFKI